MQIEFYDFFRQVLILLITITLYWPLNVPLAALAYKVRIGTAPVPMPVLQYWLRSAAAALGMGVMSLSLMGFDSVLTASGFPAGPVHLLTFLLYVPLGAGWMFTVFALADGWEGLSTLLLFVFIPGFVLVLLKLWFEVELPHFINVKDWIAEVPSSV